MLRKEPPQLVAQGFPVSVDMFTFCVFCGCFRIPSERAPNLQENYSHNSAYKRAHFMRKYWALVGSPEQEDLRGNVEVVLSDAAPFHTPAMYEFVC